MYILHVPTQIKDYRLLLYCDNLNMFTSWKGGRKEAFAYLHVCLH